jgi:hypothetical protein
MGIYPEGTLGRFLAMRRTERSSWKLQKFQVRGKINHLALAD